MPRVGHLPTLIATFSSGELAFHALLEKSSTQRRLRTFRRCSLFLWLEYWAYISASICMAVLRRQQSLALAIGNVHVCFIVDVTVYILHCTRVLAYTQSGSKSFILAATFDRDPKFNVTLILLNGTWHDGNCSISTLSARNKQTIILNRLCVWLCVWLWLKIDCFAHRITYISV